jgi:carboxyl-terminal processing protease
MRRLLFLLIAAAVVSTATAAQSSVATSTGLQLFDEVWKTVNDSFYDPTFGGLDWVRVRDELRPRAAAASSIDAARAVVVEMLGRLKRSHFALLPQSSVAADDTMLRGEATIDGLEFRVAGNDVVITRHRPAGVTGADPKDALTGRVIVAIDGRSVVPAAGAPALLTWRRVNAAMHGYDGSTAVIELADRTRISMKRTVPSGVPVRFSNLPPMHVRVDRYPVTTPNGRTAGVIGFNIWMAQIDLPVETAVDKFRGADGLIFDLRGNPGGLAGLITNIAGHVLATPDLLGTMRTRLVPQLKFVANPRMSTADGRSVEPYGGPVAILVDEMTASASECFAGGLQDLGRARIFGRRSMGQALPASTKRLANGDVLEYAVGDFVTSKGRSLEGTGVVPDETQPLSIPSLLAGHDDPLRAALAWIDTRSKTGR